MESDNNLPNLPNEIIIKIFLYLPTGFLRQLCLECRNFPIRLDASFWIAKAHIDFGYSEWEFSQSTSSGYHRYMELLMRHGIPPIHYVKSGLFDWRLFLIR